MESIGIVLAMLAAVLISGVIGRVIPAAIPLPLIQIALGMLISGVFEEGVTLSPDVFFLLFLPPLLFLDGWRIPKDALRRDWAGIVLLALGLVLITVVGLGYVIHWMVPAMPLAVAFALAAIVSPTDAVAVGGIARKLGIPRRLMAILEGEALFNDASGLVAFRVAVAAAATGAFALTSAATSFVWVSLAGLASGAMLAWSVTVVRDRFTQRFGEEPGSEVLLSLLIPFGAYFLAEWAQASGILAAVAAGLVMSYDELYGRTSAMTRIRRRTIWDMIQFSLNGIMFVLLGEQLPGIFEGATAAAEQSGHHNPGWLVVYTLVICTVLFMMRFCWIFASLTVLHRPRAQSTQKPTLRTLLILSLGGVRGAVTLAGVMSLPLMVQSGQAFPARDLAIFLAACVIIISLLLASIGLPWLLRGAPHIPIGAYDSQHYIAQRAAHAAARARLHSATPRVDETTDLEAVRAQEESVVRTLAYLDDVLQISTGTHNDEQARIARQAEIAMHREALDAARNAIYQLARQRTISDALAREMVQRLDLDELSL